METALRFTGNSSACVALMSTFSSSNNMVIKHFPKKKFASWILSRGPCANVPHQDTSHAPPHSIMPLTDCRISVVLLYLWQILPRSTETHTPQHEAGMMCLCWSVAFNMMPMKVTFLASGGCKSYKLWCDVFFFGLLCHAVMKLQLVMHLGNSVYAQILHHMS